MTTTCLESVSVDRLRHDLFFLSSDPLPYRKANFTRPGQDVSSLTETDRWLETQLAHAGWSVRRVPQRVQAFRCDCTKPIHHWYSAPDPQDPWYDTSNVEAEWRGSHCPEEIIQLVSHKDSMSWIDSPGAHDNCVGTVANLEVARVLAECPPRRTIRLLFCNEEHAPWTSKAAAEVAATRGDALIAVLNQDSLAGKSDADRETGRLTHVVAYSTDEGRVLAERIARLNRTCGIGLDVSVVLKQNINDDDGMFIHAGFRHTVMNVGSLPYADAEYHLPGDRPERVDLENLRRSTQLVLAAVLDLDRTGAS